jgi:hypothetical protein
MLQNITLDHLKGKTIKEFQITEDSESGGEHSSEKSSHYRKCRGANIEFGDGTVVNFSGYGSDSDIHYWANVDVEAPPRRTPI